MAISTLHITLSPDCSYATRPNILYPGSDAQADAAELRADARMEDSLSPITVAAELINSNDT